MILGWQRHLNLEFVTLLESGRPKAACLEQDLAGQRRVLRPNRNYLELHFHVEVSFPA
jgi:hypothetical protein